MGKGKYSTQNISRTHRVGLSPLMEARLRRTLRRNVPSEPWIDPQFKTFGDIDPR